MYRNLSFRCVKISGPCDRDQARRASAAVACSAALRSPLRPRSGSAACSASASAAGQAPAPAATGHAGHGDFPHATFAKGGAVDHRANGFHPTEILRDFDYGKTRRLASGRVLREWEIVAQDKRDRSRAGRQVRGLDLQRPRPRPDPAGPRGGAAADPLRQRLRTPAHDALPRHPPGADGRDAGDRRAPGRRPDRTGGELHLRIRRHALRPPPLPLPRRPARRPHRPRPLRRLHHRPQGGAARSRRDGDGDERLRHQLRPRQRGLRGQHGRLPLHQRADPGRAREASAHLPGQRARVRPAQLVPHPRQLLPLLPDRDLAAAERVHRHGDPGPGPARHPRARVPLRRRLHVPRPRQRVRRARLDRVLPRRRPRAPDRRRGRGGLLRAALGRERQA